MVHRNARLTFHGRVLLVERVAAGSPVAHVAKAMGISRQCAHRWIKRFDSEGKAGLYDRSSRPHRSPNRTPAALERRVLNARTKLRTGPAFIAAETGVAERTVTRILRRHNIPRLYECDPLTGDVIRASKTTAIRYERPTPGDLIHIDVKKLGRIPPGGGWRAHGRKMGSTAKRKKTKIGYDYIHSAVDDHSRLAYSEIHENEQGPTCAGFIIRAATFFADHGIDRISQVMTDNHWSYTKTIAFADALANIGAEHITIRAHCPWQNGKVERFNRTLQTEWAYRRVYTSNAQRSRALEPWLHTYNNHRNHSSLDGHPPISRLTPT